jgi:hypothetical protein
MRKKDKVQNLIRKLSIRLRKLIQLSGNNFIF